MKNRKAISILLVVYLCSDSMGFVVGSSRSSLARASQLSSLNCALILSILRSNQRNALSKRRAIFFVPEAQLFLPFIGSLFTEKKTKTLSVPEARHQHLNSYFCIFIIKTLALQKQLRNWQLS